MQNWELLVLEHYDLGLAASATDVVIEHGIPAALASQYIAELVKRRKEDQKEDILPYEKDAVKLSLIGEYDEAVRIIRKRTGCGLAAAKDRIGVLRDTLSEELFRELSAEKPAGLSDPIERFANSLAELSQFERGGGIKGAKKRS